MLSYSRLSTGQSAADCMKLCRANQECYSFNYNKLTKWCYLGITDESDLKQTSNGKWTVGYRKCVEHSDSNTWGGEQYSSGSGGAPGPVTDLSVFDSSSTSNALTISFTTPATAGTNSDGAPSTINTYKITCTPIDTATTRSVTKNYSPEQASCTAPDTSCTVQFGGLSLVDYTCSVRAINEALVQGPAVVSDPVKVCGLGLLSCSGSCIDGQTDPNNCGACGNVCPGGQTCNVGTCA